MAKKKYLNIYYMFLLGVLFVMFFGLFSNSYAITETEYKNILTKIDNYLDNDYKEIYANSKPYVYQCLSSKYDENLQNMNSFVCGIYGDTVRLFFYDKANTKVYFSHPSVYIKNLNNSSFFCYGTDGRSTVLYYSSLNNNCYINTVTGNSREYEISTITQLMSRILTNDVIYSSLNSNTEYTNNKIIKIEIEPPKTINLTATSNHKFGFNDKNQLQVNIEGDWIIEDFSFYIQKNNDGEWGNYTDVNDYYRLADYSNPYYIFWNNINYFPVGTYRYIADYGSIGEQLYYSNEFQITNSVIDNTGTGTVGDQNIDINIDTGETVDNIKDFLGGDPTTTENELQSSFPTVNIDDPSHNFFVWVFDSIENIFTTTENRTFTFSLFSGTSYTIHSNDITIPDNVVKTLVGLSCDFAICYYIIRDIHKTIEKVKKGNFESIAEEDISANML